MLQNNQRVSLARQGCVMIVCFHHERRVWRQQEFFFFFEFGVLFHTFRHVGMHTKHCRPTAIVPSRKLCSCLLIGGPAGEVLPCELLLGWVQALELLCHTPVQQTHLRVQRHLLVRGEQDVVVWLVLRSLISTCGRIERLVDDVTLGWKRTCRLREQGLCFEARLV